MRALKIIGTATAAVIVVIGLLLVIGIPFNFLTSTIQARVEQQTGYRLAVAGNTRIGVWPSLNVTLNDVTLQDPKDRGSSDRLTVTRVQADITLKSLWSGQPEITELAIVRPILNVPLRRERSAQPLPSSQPAAPTGDSDAPAFSIDRVTVSDGTMVFSNLRDRVENRIEGIGATAVIAADRAIAITGHARAGGQPLTVEIKAVAPPPPLGRQNIPVDLRLEAPGVLPSPLSAKAELRLNGAVVMINGLSGALGDGAFNGWASVDIASKPLVKLDLDFQRLELALAGDRPAPAASQPWSNAPFDFTGLNYVDAQARISAAELIVGDAHFAPAEIEATLAGGIVKLGVANLGAYGGQASGELVIDASAASPAYALHSDFAGVRALPLLQSAAGFDKLDGKLQAKLTLHAAGASPHAIMSSLDGTVFAVLQDGAVRGLNVAQMIRSLTSSTLSGWQEGKEQATDLSQLGASFRVDKGQAVTNDLNLVGPLVRVTGAGTVDLAGKALAFRVEPKLVMTTEGQGRAADPVGLGIPVVIDGPWDQPRIYPDMAGMLDNPDAAYAKLKEMGTGLFGANAALGGLGGSATGGAGTSDALGGKLGETLGNLLQQGIGRSRDVSTTTPGAPPSPPAQPDPNAAAPESQPMNDVLRQLFNR